MEVYKLTFSTQEYNDSMTLNARDITYTIHLNRVGYNEIQKMICKYNHELSTIAVIEDDEIYYIESKEDSPEGIVFGTVQDFILLCVYNSIYIEMHNDCEMNFARNLFKMSTYTREKLQFMCKKWRDMTNYEELKVNKIMLIWHAKQTDISNHAKDHIDDHAEDHIDEWGDDCGTDYIVNDDYATSDIASDVLSDDYAVDYGSE